MTIYEEKTVQGRFASFTLPLQEKVPPFVRKKKVLVIAGPTGVGKTRISLAIAQAIGGEVISADSMQVYTGMDIGTAKVSKKERMLVPHHLIDTRDLSESYNVMDFYQEAEQALREIFLKGHVPMVVGGTGFYINALLYGPPGGPPASPEIRGLLEEEMNRKGSLALYDRLYLLDPEYAKTITQNDRQKIIRALEIMSITRRKVSDFQRVVHEEHEALDFRCWFLYLPKEILYPLIEKRCEEMVDQGFVEEVKCLEKEGLRDNLSASQAIGYRQCLDFLRSSQTEADFARFIADFKTASRHYAKRQLTWFKKEPLFRWLDLSKVSEASAIEFIIQDFEQV